MSAMGSLLYTRPRYFLEAASGVILRAFLPLRLPEMEVSFTVESLLPF